MRRITPRPILLALTLMVVIGSIVAIELRLDARGADRGGTQASAGKQPKSGPQDARNAEDRTGLSGNAGRSDSSEHDAGGKPENSVSDEERIASRRMSFRGPGRSQARPALSIRTASQ
jgi:hypothetical protein